MDGVSIMNTMGKDRVGLDSHGMKLNQVTYSLADEVKALGNLSLEMVRGQVVENGTPHHECRHQRQPTIQPTTTTTASQSRPLLT